MDDGLGGPSRRFRADPAADQHGAVVLEELVLAAVVFALDSAPLLDERAHLTLKGGYDGDSGSIGQC
jgi:hypothetical protein